MFIRGFSYQQQRKATVSRKTSNKTHETGSWVEQLIVVEYNRGNKKIPNKP
jgi:hypothetical protein